MKVYLNKEYKCVKVEDNTFVANDSSNYIRYYFVTNANGDVIDKMDDTSVIYRNTEPSYVTVAFRRADGDVIQHLMASPKTDATGKSFFEYEITNTDGVLYKKGALEISAQFIEATLSETGGVKKVISQKVKAIAINTAHVLDNIGEEAEEYYSQYEQANNDAHAVLQTQITTNFNNIGTLHELTTDAKDDLVKAINEVDAHADANKSEIGNLSNLTTDEKTTIVGAINEVDQHADANKAEIGNLSALTTDEKATLVGAINEVDNHADNATTLANNAVATANGAVATANEAKTTAQTAETNANSALDTANAANATADEAKAIAQGSQRAIGFATLQTAITALNGYSNTQLKVGDNVYIVETGVPDLWVAAVEQNSVAYNYTTNDAFNDDLVENTLVQVGYYKFAYLESDGKPCTVAWQNMTVAASDWVASTEFEDFAYEAKIILSDFVNFSSIPQVVFGLTEATSGNYAPICKAGDKGVYIYSKVNTAITLPTVVTFAPNVHGASMQGGGYTNKGKWVASTTYAIDDLVYTDNGQFVCIEGITSTTSPEQDTAHWQATFVATGKTKNGLKISGQDNGTGVQKTFDGSTAVEIAFDENTMTAKEVNGVLEIGAKGTVPEALPQEASALKSGNLPTSGWTPTVGNFTNARTLDKANYYYKEVTIYSSGYEKYRRLTGWEVNIDGEWHKFVKESDRKYYYNSYNIEYIGSNAIIRYQPSGVYAYYQIYTDGHVSAETIYNGDVQMPAFRNTEISDQTFTISDTSITANSDILMELTDEGGVKPYSMEAGKVTVIRDTVPTQAIPYTYKVKQTNARGQFTLVNHFVPNVPAVPTKTSELTNDSGYVSNLPIVQNVVCNDVDSATTLDTTITCEVGDLILAQIIVRSALTLPTGWTLLRTIPAVETTNNQTLSFAYKRATSTSETLTVTQATAGRIYTNLVRLSNAISISYIQSCEKTGTGIKSISSTKPVTPNMVIWGAASATWNTNSPYGDWTYSPSTLYYYSLPQSTKQPRLGTFIDSSGAGERTFTGTAASSTSMMCGAVEIVGDEVARKGDIPTSLPVTYKKVSGSLPTSGWTETNTPFYTNSDPNWGSDTETTLGYCDPAIAQLTNGFMYAVNGTTYSNIRVGENTSEYIQLQNYDNQWIRIYKTDGRITQYKGGRIFGLKNTNYSIYTYTISDAFITANTSVKMYLTDEGGVKAQSKASGSITVIRDTVPTTAIPYEYEVEQTSAEGLFEVINAYVPAVPTKTSQLTNDSGFITAADIPSAGEWVDVTGKTATLTQAGTYQVIASVNDMQSIVYWDGSTVAYGTKSTAPSVSTSGGTAYLFINCAYPQIDASGTLSVHLLTAGNSSGAWTETNTTVSGFKYRKIN